MKSSSQKVSRDEMAFDRARGGGDTGHKKQQGSSCWHVGGACALPVSSIQSCPKLDRLGSGLMWGAGELEGKETCLWGLNY